MVNMRGVDLEIFDFDYDLTFCAFFLNGNQHIYGRYGGRDEGPPEKGLSLAGLKYAMQQALEAYRRDPDAPAQRVPKEFRTPEQYPAARRLKADACIHCHQVNNFRYEFRVQRGLWQRDDLWVYPPPENVGISVDADQGDRLVKVQADSPAARAGMRAGDVLVEVNGFPVASYGDLQYALHRSPAKGTIPVLWRRGGRTFQGRLELPQGWRRSDISWRASMWPLEPQAFVHGQDLTAEEKRRLGLEPDQLAFRQGPFVPPESRRAGIRPGDIIIGINGQTLRMSMRQFNAYVRLNFNVGDRIVYNVIRNGRRIEIPMTLTSRLQRRD